MKHTITDYREHRPWPMPSRPWVMFQRWEHLLFAHWRVPADVLTPYIPTGLNLDTYEGQAYVGVVPFLMRNIHPRGLFPVPYLSHFAELNVRTYVTDGEKRGVWFFSLDAANPIGVWLGRNWFHLPYFNATMPADIQGETVYYGCQRTHRDAAPATFNATYRPTSSPFFAQAGTLEHFLTERYCLYTTTGGRLQRGEIHHAPWSLQHADATITANTMPPFALPDESPLLIYAAGIDVVVWPLA
ncbi:MAG: DUF2071 domain-containing protein [Anaerolineales bacterium]|nr:DUF2071 domain-containing protein [Anaerolineales bacterium]